LIRAPFFVFLPAIDPPLVAVREQAAFIIRSDWAHHKVMIATNKKSTIEEKTSTEKPARLRNKNIWRLSGDSQGSRDGASLKSSTRILGCLKTITAQAASGIAPTKGFTKITRANPLPMRPMTQIA
jgi:hypothetical protein